MRALLDTNILIHREAPVVVRTTIGQLFFWLDKLRYDKCVHPVSVGEIEEHGDERVRNAFRAKLQSYQVLKFTSALAAPVQSVSDQLDRTDNDRDDTKLLNELFVGRVDILITEDRKIHRKAALLNLVDRVFTIDQFLEKVAAENPELADYKVLSVRKTQFGFVNVADPFFDSFRADYPGFDTWFMRKSDELVYVCLNGNALAAFLYLKVERPDEPYPDILPAFAPQRRLKIGTFKALLNGFKLGERFLKIVFDNAIRQRVDEIYVTIFPDTVEQQRLIGLLEDFGFVLFGTKKTGERFEFVYVRSMAPAFNTTEPQVTFPYVSRSSRTFLVPIYGEYHTDLLPDSILNTESPADFVEMEPHRNAIRKVYVSRSIRRDLLPGDTIVFYRAGGNKYKSVVTTLGIVERCRIDLSSEEEFLRACRHRSVFTDAELRAQWNYKRWDRPFVVEFLYAYSFPKRPNLDILVTEGVISSVMNAPRGFERITSEQFDTILRLSKADTRLIVD